MDRMVLLAALALVATLVPQPPAAACSCAHVSAAEMVEQDPDVAIAVVRRVDRDGGSAGIGLVERTLRGSLPDEVPLDLDDGASCKPWLGYGHLATLAFEPAGGSWRTFDCSQLDTATTFASAYGGFDADGSARAEPAVLLTGALPGAAMVLLDAALEVLATASGPPAAELVEHCGDTVVVTGTDGEQHVVRRHSLPDLRTVDERELGAAASRERIVDLACRADGRVAALTSAGDDPHRGLTVHEDLFGAGTWPLPPAADAAFAGDGIVLLRSDREGGTSELELHDLGTREVSTLARFDGLDAYELTVAPGGGHLTVRGSADEPVLLVVDAASGETVARSTGEWMPVPEPWLDDRRLLLRDEDRGLGSPPGAAYRLVDVNLEEVRGFAAVAGLTHTGVAAVEGHVIGVGGAELAVVRPDGSVRASADPRTAAAWGAVLLGPVSPDAGTGGGVTAPEAPDPSPGATAGGDPPEAGAAWDAGRPGASRAVAALILLAAIGLLASVPGARRRARKAAAATSWRTRSRGSRRRRGR